MGIWMVYSLFSIKTCIFVFKNSNGKSSNNKEKRKLAFSRWIKVKVKMRFLMNFEVDRFR
jgi:hypothetical protein